MYHKPLDRASSGTPPDWGKSTLRALLYSFALPLVQIAALNLVLNPLGVYPTHWFPPTEQNLRRYKYDQVRRLGLHPSTVVFGSSRVMTMRANDVQRYLPGDCYNFSMQSAAAEDWYAGLRLLVEDLHAPVRNVIIGVDYEAFNPAIPTMSEGRYFPQFSRYFIHTKLRSRTLEQLSLLLSAEQVDASIGVLQHRLAAEQGAPKKLIRPDGTLILADREGEIKAGTFNLDAVLNARVRKYASRSLHLEGYLRPSAERLLYLDDLLEYAAQHGIRVYLYVTPYHPRLWQTLDELPGIEVLQQTEEQVVAHCAAYGAELRDFSHIESFGGDPTQFYDEIHMWPDNQARLLKALLGNAR